MQSTSVGRFHDYSHSCLQQKNYGVTRQQAVRLVCEGRSRLRGLGTTVCSVFLCGFDARLPNSSTLNLRLCGFNQRTTQLEGAAPEQEAADRQDSRFGVGRDGRGTEEGYGGDRNSILVLKFVILSMLKEQFCEHSQPAGSISDQPHGPEMRQASWGDGDAGEGPAEGQEGSFEEGLKAKLQRLRAFVANLGPLRQSQINPEWLQQLEVQEEVWRKVGSETVVAEAQKRIQKMTKTRKLKRNWSVCDLKILIWLICKHCEQSGVPVGQVHLHRESWQLISSLIPGTSTDSCLFKWLSLRRHKITLHGWAQEEERILLQLEQKHADSRNKWKFISEELYALNPSPDKIYRHPKQCREHYASFLDPSIKKGPWTKHEDLTLLSHIIHHAGEKKWCRLVKILQGRTQNAIKNRFQLVFAKLRKRKENKSKPELELITDYVRENGGLLPLPAPLSQPSTPPPSPSPAPPSPQLAPSPPPPQQPVGPKLPLIPTFNFFPSSRSLSAFVPYLQEPLYQQLPENVYRELTRRSLGSAESLPPS